MQLKAIETEYKGYRFRSRLEARWAVFFETIGYRWEYEPEGFELPSGRYLPDFFVEEGGYFEVKPSLASIDEYSWTRLLEFEKALESKGEQLHILDGSPDFIPYFRPSWARDERDKHALDRWARCGDIMWRYKEDGFWFWAQSMGSADELNWFEEYCSDKPFAEHRYPRAVRAARAERFGT